MKIIIVKDDITFCKNLFLLFTKKYFGGLRRFDMPRKLSFLVRINDRCFALRNNYNLDGLASSIKKYLIYKHGVV